MIRVLFIGDGERDAVTVPPLVEGILKAKVAPSFRPWARLHGPARKARGVPKGYARKLRFALLQARDAGADGLVATVDRDKAPARSRLRELRKGRNEERTGHPPFPTALGEANPHAETWLLDDPIAVREALRLPASIAIPPAATVKSPKDELARLQQLGERNGERAVDVLRDIAVLVDVSRQRHAKQTGLTAFVRDLRDEFAGLAGTAR